MGVIVSNVAILPERIGDMKTESVKSLDSRHVKASHKTESQREEQS